MNTVFEVGNLESGKGPDETDWRVGQFVQGPRHSQHVAIKWAIHNAGSLAEKPWAACLRATTLAVLISGKFRIDFCRVPDGDYRSIHLSDPGDFVLFGPGLPHKSESLEPATRFLTVRWPSLGLEDTITFGLQRPTNADLRLLDEAISALSV